VGAITKVADLHPNGLQGWPELLNYIVQAAQHENVDARDLSFVLLREVREGRGEIGNLNPTQA
jgi:hypothetical protein